METLSASPAPLLSATHAAVQMTSLTPRAPAVAVGAAPQTHLATAQVSVPTGAAAGQVLCFTPPGSTQSVSVTMAQRVEPGSIVTVQYPLAAFEVASATRVAAPHNQALPPSAPIVPPAPQQVQPVQPQIYQSHAGLAPVPVQVDEDEQSQKKLWILYAMGWFCGCTFCPILTPFLWFAACGLYYCRAPSRRLLLPRSKLPALTALITLSLCMALGMVGVVGAIGWQHRHHYGHEHHHGHGWKHRHGHRHGHDKEEEFDEAPAKTSYSYSWSYDSQASDMNTTMGEFEETRVGHEHYHGHGGKHRHGHRHGHDEEEEFDETPAKNSYSYSYSYYSEEPVAI